MKIFLIILDQNKIWHIENLINNFISFIENNEEHAMHSKSCNIGIMIKEEADKVIKELFN